MINYLSFGFVVINILCYAGLIFSFIVMGKMGIHFNQR